jgi:hypothetical protein
MTTLYNSNFHETMPFSDTCAQFNLGANAEQTMTVPGAPITPGKPPKQFQALFSYNSTANVFVSINETPIVPTLGTPGDQKTSEFRPEKRYVNGGDVIHIITPDTSAYVGVSLRDLNQ